MNEIHLAGIVADKNLFVLFTGAMLPPKNNPLRI